ncbi:MAG: non-specific endonuclease [Solimicrobium sp.]|nr:non-specific endonuclease [Solimicrobium sp.]
MTIIFKKACTIRRQLFFWLLLNLSFTVNAADFACTQFFWQERIPVIQNEKMLLSSALCFSEFAILHSGRSKTPIYTAERLNKNTLKQAYLYQRTDQFYAEPRLLRARRAELSDYRGSGFDHGHLVPAGDSTTEESMAQSFSLANIVPQRPVNNRQVWASIEKATRKYVMRASGDVYVISGPVFPSHPQRIGENLVWVPAFLFKLVFDPDKNKAWAYWVENKDDAKIGPIISYEDLVVRTGMRLLPDFESF